MGENKQRLVKWLKARPILMVGLILIILCGIAYGALYRSKKAGAPGNGPGEAIAADKGKRFNFLLLGSDARYGEQLSRSDSIIFVSADTQNKRLVFLSIPRDTLVDIPGYGRERINAAMAYGGPELTVDVVSRLIGQPIDYYVVTNYEGFVKLVDTLGGITLYVDKNMYHYDPERGGRFSINLSKGLHHLDGEKALMYVRYRGDPLGDINRVDRQQKFLCAVAKEMLKPRNIVKAPVLIPKVKDCIYTNLPLKEMLVLARMARNLEDVQMINGTLPGYFAGDPYWHVDPDEARRAVAALLSGEPVRQIVKDIPAGVVVMHVNEPKTPVTVTYGSYGTVSEEGYQSVSERSYSQTPPWINVEIVPGNDNSESQPGTVQEPSSETRQGDGQEELPLRTPPDSQQPEVPPQPVETSGTVYNVYNHE
ncbi:MAG: LCP family protein [Firmicutes bacterium]|nr:LCP family protein [Bacillota bacterium]